MTRRFCILCGKATDELIENTCVDCFSKETSILHLPEKVKGEICGLCLARKSHGRWIEPATDEEKAIVDDAMAALQESMTIEVSDAEVKVEAGAVKKSSDKLFLVPFQVTVKGDVEGVVLESKGSTTAYVRVGICDDCNRMRSGYFEAVLQVRGEDGLDKEQRRRVTAVIEESLHSSRDKRSFVSNVEDLKVGIDFYMGSVKAARKISKALKEKFGAKVSESPTLMGRKNGKDLYRSSIAVRLPNKRIIK